MDGTFADPHAAMYLRNESGDVDGSPLILLRHVKARNAFVQTKYPLAREVTNHPSSQWRKAFVNLIGTGREFVD